LRGALTTGIGGRSTGRKGVQSILGPGGARAMGKGGLGKKKKTESVKFEKKQGGKENERNQKKGTEAQLLQPGQ